MHFAGSNLSTDPKSLKCIYKILKNFRVEKSGEISRNLRFFVISCLHLNQTLIMAGIVGLEPTRAGVKVLCLYRLGYIPSYHISIPYSEQFVNSYIKILMI